MNFVKKKQLGQKGLQSLDFLSALFIIHKAQTTKHLINVIKKVND